MNKFFLGLLGFIPATLLAEYYFHLSGLWIFCLSALAIVPLAKYIGEATESLSVHTGSAMGGFLNATFGNATELLISIFALRAGLSEIVKASITGSILGNLLLVAGMSIFFGGLKRKKQTFNKTGISAATSTLLLACIALIMPAIFVQTSPGVSEVVVEKISIFVSITMLLVYFGSLLFTLKTHSHLYTEEVGEENADAWAVGKSVVILLASTISVAWMSEILVGSIEPVVEGLGWTPLFVGVVVIAIVGNAAEHASAITMAVKNRMDLALQISVGSSTQIATFVAPVLVLISLLFASHMTLIFNLFEIIAIVLSVLITKSVVEDGESNWFEGLQLLITYIILAIVFFFHT
jgi:Ca2+:H+ antiporter